MSERVFRKLGLSDLQMLADTKKDAGALAIWPVDEEHARLFLSNPMNCFFACIDDNKIIAYACGYELDRLDNTGNMLYIHGVGVHADYRRQGIGKQMLNEIKALCRLTGMCRFFLCTWKSNTAACALYDSVGGEIGHDDDVSYYFNKLD